MISWICLSIILFIAFLITYAFVTNSGIKKSQFKAMWFVIIVCSFFLVLLFEPKSFIDWDLIRIVNLVQKIKDVGINEALKYSDVRDLYVFKGWMWIASQFTNLNIVSAVPFCIVLTISGYLMIDNLPANEKNVLSGKRIFSQLLIWLSLFGLKLSISGIRCALAMAICSYALYNEYIKEKHKLWYYALYVISLLIHQFALFFVLFRLCIYIKKKWVLLVGAFVISQLIYPIALLIRNNSTNEYFWMATDKLVRMWSLYGTSRIFTLELATIGIFVCFIIIVVLGVIISFGNRRHTGEFSRKAFLSNEALVTLSCLGLGFCSNFLLLERTMYIFAYIMSINFVLTNRDKSNMVYIMSPILLFLLYFNDINIFIVNFLGYYFL